MLIDQLNELGREEVASIVLQHVQCFKIEVMNVNKCLTTVDQV